MGWRVHAAARTGYCAARSRTQLPSTAHPPSRLLSPACLCVAAVARSYIYSNAKSFASQPSSYKCPVCKAPKAAFEEKDTAGVTALLPVVAVLIAAAVAAGFVVLKL
jgi:hypothetical protein